MAKKTKNPKKRTKGKPLSQALREKDEARAELERELAADEAESAADVDDEDDLADAGDEFEDDLAALEDDENRLVLREEDDEDVADEDSAEGEDGEYDDEEYEDEEDDEEGAAQMGHQRYVMAGFFGLWIVVSYILGRALELLWSRVASTDWFVANLPQLAAVPHEGELVSRASVSLVLGGVLGAAGVLSYYVRPDVRTWADEVAEELGHVKWPTRKEIGNHTMVVIVASSIITLYLWLLDQFWGFATNLIYQTGA